MGEQVKNKISFGDLDTFLKIAPIIGLAVLAYLQTLFPSKVEFEKLEDHLIQMDKKNNRNNNTSKRYFEQYICHQRFKLKIKRYRDSIGKTRIQRYENKKTIEKQISKNIITNGTLIRNIYLYF